MKHAIRSFIYNAAGLWLTAQLLPTVVILGNWKILITAGVVLTLLTIFVQPILKILFLPINFITFGLFSWIINVILLYLLTIFIPQVEIHEWTFPGFSWQGFVLPSYHVNYWFALIISSLSITCIANILRIASEEG